MAGYNYSQYVAALADLMIIPITDATLAAPSSDQNFNTILPRIIEYAEQRLYRELDLVQTRVTLTATLAANVRSVSTPGNLIVLEGFNIITPAGATPDAVNATRNPVQRASLDFINYSYPVGTATNGTPSIPSYYENLDNSTVIVAPAPSDTFTAEFIGTVRPTTLSSTNTTTILTQYVPDIFLAASMIMGAGYQRDFGTQSSDPELAASWEQQYGKLLQSAIIETQRMKAQGQSWMPFSPAPTATPQRGP